MTTTNVEKLQEQRNKLVVEMKDLINKEDLGPEDKEVFDRMEAEESELHEQITRMVRVADKLDELDKRRAEEGEELRKRGLDAPLEDQRHGGGADKDKEPVDVNRCMRAWALGKRARGPDREYARDAGWADGDELEMRMDRGRSKSGATLEAPRTMAQIENREMAVISKAEMRQQGLSPDTAGGFTVPDEMMRAIDVALLAFGGLRQAVTVLSTATGAAMPWPTTDDTANKGEIIDENTTANDLDIVFGQIVFGAFKYSSKAVTVSYELLQDSATNIPALIGRLLGERIGRIYADHNTVGVGTTEPVGIVTASADSGVTFASNTAIAWPELLNLEHSVDPAYRGPGAGWMMADATFKLIKLIQDTQERPLWQPSLIAGAPDRFDNFPIHVNQSMPVGAAAKTILFGDLQKFVIREVLGFTLVRLDELYAKLAQVGFLAWSRMDSNLVDAGTNPIKYATSAA